MYPQTPFPEVADLINENGGESLRLCYQCGSCSASCPWRDYTSFLPRRMFKEAQHGLINFENDAIWRCVTCNKCVERCPRGVSIIDIMRALRRAIIGMGIAEPPSALASALRNLTATGNPMGEAPENRNSWAEGLDIKAFDAATEYLFFPCCVTTYDPAIRNSIVATVKVLTAAGLNFGIIDGSVCCGESVRKAGDEALFKQLAGTNTALFAGAKVKKIIVNSPHCYHTFINEYPETGGCFEVIHISQLMARLMANGQLKLQGGANRKITYHDPCYLGRHNGIYEEPRKVISAIPGVELLEMQPAKSDSLCCGGGGGRIWMETKRAERFSDKRLQQAIDTGAGTLVTSCPYCLSNLRDSSNNQAIPDDFSIIDISECIAQAL